MNIDWTPWPKTSFRNPQGKVVTGDIAYQDDRETVIRIETKAMAVPTPFGLQVLTGFYITLANEKLVSIPCP